LLYDKFVGFVEDLKTIGRHLENGHSSYTSAMNKLTEGKGNLVKKVEQLKNLGARTTKSLDNNLVREAEEEPGQPHLLNE
jgi:DNA recombination protein RmuC